MNPNYLNNQILPGYVYQGRFYPVDSSVQLGYWYNNAFYGSSYLEAGYDFTQTTDAYPCSYSQTGYQQLPPGSVPGYSYQQYYYKTYSEASQQQYNYSQYAPAPVYSRPNPWASQTISTIDSSTWNPYGSTLQPTIPPNYTTTIQSAATSRATPAIQKKKCSFCNQEHPDYMDILGKKYCLQCLKRKYEANELYSGTAASPLLWSIAIIYQVHTALRTRLPSGDQIDPNQPIKIPLDSEVCVGRNEEAAPGYPQYGHIIGKNNLCVEDSCPTTEHKLCKVCAKQLLKCPICGEFIKFEEPRFDEYHPVCDKNNHCADFERACALCHKKSTRQKVKPDAPKQEGNKTEEAALKQ